MPKRGAVVMVDIKMLTERYSIRSDSPARPREGGDPGALQMFNGFPPARERAENGTLSI